MKNIVALEGKSLPPWSEEEKAIHAILSQGHGPLSALGLTRWIKQTPDIAKADKKIAAAAKKLAAGMLIFEDEDGNYFK